MKKKCPVCQRMTDIRKLMISKLDENITENINMLSAIFLFTGICPYCEYDYSIKKRRGL